MEKIASFLFAFVLTGLFALLARLVLPERFSSLARLVKALGARGDAADRGGSERLSGPNSSRLDLHGGVLPRGRHKPGYDPHSV